MKKDSYETANAPAKYTDLALEAAELRGGPSGEGDGYTMEVSEKRIKGGSVKITWVEIQNERGAEALQRPVGNYITLENDDMKTNNVEAHEEIARILADILAKLNVVKTARTILAAGLGNWNVTPDALGPRAVSKLLVTRHLEAELPDNLKKRVRVVAAVSPGVMGITGIETGEILCGIVDRIKPDLVIAIDALAARRASRVNATIQIADTGLYPGSGMGNTRMALNEKTLGVPVIALGAPTVVDAATLVNDTMDLMLDEMTAALPEGSPFYETLKGLGDEEKYGLIKRTLDPYVGNMFVTPKEVDNVINHLAGIMANMLNIALHPGVTREDVNRYL